MRKGWEYKKLGEVATFINGDRGKNYPSAKDFVESGVPFINAGHLNNGIINYDKMNYITINKYNSLGSGKIIKNDILFCLRGSLGKYAIVAEDSMGAIASSLVIIRPFQNADNRFIAHFLSTAKIKEYIAKNNNGSSQPNLSAKSVASFIIPLPTLSTQLAIVSELDKINELIRLKKEQLKDFDNLAQSLFYEMFGDPVENEKGWKVKKLGAVSIYPNKRIQVSELNPQDYVGVENLQKNRAGIVFSDKIPNTDSAIAFSPNDILIGNIRPYLKKIWLADKSGGASGDVVIIRICTKDLQPMYLYKVLASDQFFEYDNTYTKGAKMPRGDRKAIAKFMVPLPPLSLQRLFAQRIEQIEREKSEVQKSIQNLETLLASRMQYWFE